MIEQTIFIQGLATNFISLGVGRPFLILHGWGSKAEKWQKVGELLAEKGFKVIIPDLPGFGASQQPLKAWGLEEYSNFTQDFAKAINLEKFYLAGHSFGGALAAKYALRKPEQIEKLFLIGAALIRKQGLKHKFLAILAKIFKVFSFLPFYSLLRKAFYKFVVQKSDYPYFKGIMKESYLKIIKEDLSDMLSQIKSPTTIIWGKNDKITPLSQAKIINSKIFNSDLVVIPGAGHDLEQQTPAELAKIIIRTLGNN